MKNFTSFCFLSLLFLTACQAAPPATSTAVPILPTTAVAQLPSSTPSPTATATATLIPSPTSSPTAVASPTASITPSPTPIPTATPDVALYGTIDQLVPAEAVLFWHAYTGFAQTVLEEMVETFNRDNPYGIQVQVVGMGGYGELHDAVLASLDDPANRPQLTAAFPDKTVAYATAVLDLRPYLHHPLYGYSRDELAQFWGPVGQTETAVWGLPLHRTIELVYINDELLTELPLTFSGHPQTPAQFAEAACAAAENGQMGYQIELSSGNFLAWLLAFGAKLYDETEQQSTFHTAEAVAAMEFLQQLVADGCATAVDGFSYQTDFGRQALLFGPGTTRSLYFYGRAVEEQSSQPFAWSVSPFPTENGQPVTLLNGPDVILLHSEPSAQLAAWLFLKYFFTVDLQAQWSQVNDHLPARADTAVALTGLFNEQPAYETAFDLMPYGQTVPAYTGEFVVWQAILTTYGRVLQGEPAAALLTELDQTVNNYLVNK